MKNQKGMTVVGMLLTAAIVIIVLITVMRIVPVYIEYYSIRNSISTLEKIPASEFTTDPSSNVQVLHDKLVNQLYINSIELPESTILITPKEENIYTVQVKYQVIKHLVAQISLLFDFDLQKEVHIATT